MPRAHEDLWTDEHEDHDQGLAGVVAYEEIEEHAKGIDSEKERHTHG